MIDEERERLRYAADHLDTALTAMELRLVEPHELSIARGAVLAAKAILDRMLAEETEKDKQP
jgi:hypothetical protein